MAYMLKAGKQNDLVSAITGRNSLYNRFALKKHKISFPLNAETGYNYSLFGNKNFDISMQQYLKDKPIRLNGCCRSICA
jgi:hypothetical protein